MMYQVTIYTAHGAYHVDALKIDGDKLVLLENAVFTSFLAMAARLARVDAIPAFGIIHNFEANKLGDGIWRFKWSY